jgi:hypothetical protein
MKTAERLLICAALMGLGALALWAAQKHVAVLSPRPPEPQTFTLVAVCENDEHAVSKLPAVWQLASQKLALQQCVPTDIALTITPASALETRTATYRLTVQKPENVAFTLKDWEFETLAPLEDATFRFTNIMAHPVTGPVKSRPQPFLVVVMDGKSK